MDDGRILRLDRYLAAQRLGIGSVQALTKFSGGQSNPTYLLECTSGRYVLRRKPSGAILPSAHAIDREFRLLRALASTDVPVARAVHYCGDPEILGTAFYIMSHVDGVVYWDAALPELAVSHRAGIFHAMADTLAALHHVDWQAAGLADFGKPSGYAARQTALWTRQYLASEPGEMTRVMAIVDWLSAHIPQDDRRATLVHGDFRIDNLMFSRADDRVLAVLDWELATLGHPCADLAYMVMHHRLANDGVFRGLGGIDRTQAGLPAEDALIARYCESVGQPRPKDLSFWIVLASFRLIAILEGVNARIRQGNAADPERGKDLVKAIPDLLRIAEAEQQRAGQ